MTARLRLPKLAAASLALGCIAADDVAKDAPKGRWTLGTGGESCDQVCHGAGGTCVDSAWPMSKEQFGDIAASLGYECRDLGSGGAAYDPSASDFSCGWQGYVARPRVQLTRCSATPPMFAIRFCPCMQGPGGQAEQAPAEAPAQAPADAPAGEEGTFDCNEGFAKWEKGWSDSKKQFCCEKEGRGCPTMSTKPFDCAAGLDNFLAGWSPQKRAWCCEHEQQGCAYDCDAGFSNWHAGWSDVKKQYCCKHEQKGCPEQRKMYGYGVDAPQRRLHV